MIGGSAITVINNARGGEITPEGLLLVLAVLGAIALAAVGTVLLHAFRRHVGPRGSRPPARMPPPPAP